METYQTLNRELVSSVCDLRKENCALRDLVTSLKAENMKLAREHSDYKRRVSDAFSKLSQEFVNCTKEVLEEVPKVSFQQEMSKMRYSVAMNSSVIGTLPRSSPDKCQQNKVAAASFVNIRRRNSFRQPKENAASIQNIHEDYEPQDMSTDGIKEWLRKDSIPAISVEVPALETEEQRREDEPPQQTEDTVPNKDLIYKNMTTIIEENSKNNTSCSAKLHNSVANVAKFAASTPHNGKVATSEPVRMELSPIPFSDGSRDEKCRLASRETRDHIFEPIFTKQTSLSSEMSNGDSSSSSWRPSLSPEPLSRVTVRRRKGRIQDVSPTINLAQESEVQNVEMQETENKSEEITSPVKAKRKPNKKISKRQKLGDRTNLTATDETSSQVCPQPIKVENLEEETLSRRPRRRAAPQNLTEPKISGKMRRT
ncbi:uncharacterized protein LOC132258359 isoform X2 [Phlebotomus argentipes]|uniref:uncharacterized protein LOC132258359 isoform X2 n=1 Tax=Phlebotomus argentipes TaxID=94469 RepID=UPI00289351FA|nr:uncharacterized protein LOC132258359 isoform X2 [Phlebotomus argentipes]